MGIESQKLVLDARNAVLASFADSGGIGVPFAAFSLVQPIIFFCAGQIMSQTFRNITIPMPPPAAIESDLLLMSGFPRTKRSAVIIKSIRTAMITAKTAPLLRAPVLGCTKK